MLILHKTTPTTKFSCLFDWNVFRPRPIEKVISKREKYISFYPVKPRIRLSLKKVTKRFFKNFHKQETLFLLLSLFILFLTLGNFYLMQNLNLAAKGVVLGQTDNTYDPVSDLNELIIKSPGYFPAYLEIGRIYLDRNQPDMAANYLLKAFMLNPNAEETVLLLRSAKIKF